MIPYFFRLTYTTIEWVDGEPVSRYNKEFFSHTDRFGLGLKVAALAAKGTTVHVCRRSEQR